MFQGFMWFHVNSRVLIPNPVSASRKTYSIYANRKKIKMTVKMAASPVNPFYYYVGNSEVV